jgi:hypothetical protein
MMLAFASLLGRATCCSMMEGGEQAGVGEYMCEKDKRGGVRLAL